jgi:acyl transferase domain-containing protein
LQNLSQENEDLMASINPSSSAGHNLDIALVGMAGRFPGANNVEEFWNNLVEGVESISWCSEQEIIASGFHPDIARDPDFVAAAGKLEGEHLFDAEFFGFAPREAQLLDPQQRLLLECAWEALESAGYNPETYSGRIGVFAGASTNTYFPFHIASNPQLLSSVGILQAITANDKDFLASRVAYKLNLKGPAISVQTACSTSLVAVNLACSSLLSCQCDMVLAGGVSVTPKGRLFKDGFIFSRDGHCRPFDEAAQGAVFGNGVGVVVLKRLEDALADGDYIYAVIKGSAVNNDGSLKAGYTAPSVTGQMEAIVEAQTLGGVHPETIRYIEAHGTGTALGDPIEIAALTQAFRVQTDKTAYCAVGSVKGNIGHLDAAAGIGGLIKTALVLDRKQIPPTLHFHKASPRLNLESSPFFINAALRDWPVDDLPRRAAVSSFGFGGTNAHAILEEAPERSPSASEPDWQLIPISARTKAALQATSRKLSEFFETHPAANVADAAFTLQVGRKHFNKRAFAVVRNGAEAASIFATQDSGRFKSDERHEDVPGVVFMFPGQGSQSVKMAREIYRSEPLFREVVDQCAGVASRYLNRNLLDLIYPEGEGSVSESLLTQTEYAQPALFIIEYALATLWRSWGIQPAAMIGHSVGEYVAACLAGVFTLEDAIKLICARAAAMQPEPAGAMMSVPLSEMDLIALLPSDLSLAAANSPNSSVVAGTLQAVGAFRILLDARGVSGRLLRVSHAFHSPMMERAALRFSEACEGVQMSPPQIPFVSNLTGEFADAAEVTTASYWVRHMLSTVRFSDGWMRLAENRGAAFLEAGPGQVLTTLAGQCVETLGGGAATMVLPSCGHGSRSDRAQILTSLGNLWMRGIMPDWSALHRDRVRRRMPLPTYQFQRKLYWLPPVHATPGVVSACAPSEAGELQAAPLHNEPETAAPRSATHDDLENVITSIWREVLGVDEVGLEEDFFVLGGHSLMAIQLIAEIRRRTGAEVPVRVLIQNPTVATLAGKIRESGSRFEVDAEHRAIQPVSRDGDLPLTFHQEDVWDFETRMPGTARYTGVVSMSLEGVLSPAGVESAMNRILARHEVLRTTYGADGGRPRAFVHPPQALCIPVRDISRLGEPSRQRELVREANRLVRTPFDLAHDLLLRVLLFKTGATQHVLMFSSHYIAVDGWTVGLILKEFGEHYAAFVKGRPANVPDARIQCIDYASWQKSRFSGQSLPSHLSYWREQLSDLPPQEPMPLDHPRPRTNTMMGSTHHFRLTPELTRNLKHFSHQNGSTLFFTLLSALNVLFHLRSESEDIVIGTITGDREPGMEAVFGSFVNCLPLRNRVQRQQTFLEVMENVRRVTSDAYTHHIPFHHIAGAVDPERNLINDPLFRVSLVLRNIPFTEMETAGLDVQLLALPVDRAVSEGDISLYLQEAGGVLSGYFEFNPEILEARTMTKLADDFVRLLDEAAAHPRFRLCDFISSFESAETCADRVGELSCAG